MLQDLPKTRIPTFSKVCDAYDWFDPALDRVIREALRVEPFTNRRQWEFAMIYLALHEADALRPDARGLGLGVGAERLIFALAERVAEIRATDLYEPGSRWVGVRTDDPQALVAAKAPPFARNGILDRIRAERADMRDLSYPSDSFDFAWSTGAFEHIGEDADFLAHLNEVDRVLKPGGVYAFTTVLSYERETSRIPHNHYFHPEHFLDLLHASRLRPDPVYDVRIARNHLNRPMIETLRPYGLGGVERHLHPVTSWRRGIVTVANVTFLRKGDGGPKTRPKVQGLKKTQGWLQRVAHAANDAFWSEWTPLALEAEGRPMTSWHFFGSGPVELEIEAPSPGEATLRVRGRITPGEARTERRLDFGRGRSLHRFEADAEATYAIALKDGAVEAPRLRARRV
jgi:SAM-dependent methyltransferase